MKTYKLLINALFVTALSLSLNSLAFAQKTTLPPSLTENSSFEEILNWLDKTTLHEARIGLESNAPGAEPDEIPTSATRYYERAFFSKGFNLAKIDGCKITLRNNNAELIRFETKFPNPAEGSLDEFRKTQNNQSQFTGEIFIPLQAIKPNKAPYRHTKKAETAALLGTWRTEFKPKSNSSLFSLFPVIWSKEKAKEKIGKFRENAMRVKIINTEQNEQNDLMYGDEITFTFDDKQISENFYVAFSRAITHCKDE
ncbi:MAG: hypothetical protein WKF92_09635 [Pyrinomonadaceae bacterium]